MTTTEPLYQSLLWVSHPNHHDDIRSILQTLHCRFFSYSVLNAESTRSLVTVQFYEEDNASRIASLVRALKALDPFFEMTRCEFGYAFLNTLYAIAANEQEGMTYVETITFGAAKQTQNEITWEDAREQQLRHL